jgi:hypothetical protein
LSGRPSHPGLLSLRVGAVLLVLLLLVDPRIPGDDPAESGPPAPTQRVLVDPDPALAADDGEGLLLDRFLERASTLHSGGGVLHRLTGSEGVVVDPATLEAMGPAEVSGGIDEVLLQMAEGGADSLLLLSTLRVDPAPLLEVLERLPLPLRVERVGGPVRNAALVALELPDRVPADEPVEARVRIRGEETAPGDSIGLRIEAGPFRSGMAEDAEPRIVYEARHPAPPSGEEITLSVVLPPPSDGAPLLRYEARVVLDGDGFAPDDARVRVVEVGEAGPGIVVLSLRPDWEPRTLLPVLERSTGLEGEGWLQVGPDRYLGLRGGDDPVDHRSPGEVAPRIEGAELLVVHGVGGAEAPEDPLRLPAGLEAAVRGHPRVIHLPAGPAGAALAGVPVEGPQAGALSPHPDPPPSPVASYLAGIPLGGLPPLDALLRPVGETPGIEALHLRGGAGEVHPGMLLLEGERGRSALALGSGFWRWGIREGDPRRAYANLWGGVSGWLLGSPGPAAGVGVHPVDRVFPRGEPVQWSAMGFEGRSLEVELRRAEDPEGPALQLEEVEVSDEGRFRTPVLPPGSYHYRVLDPDEGTDPQAEGLFEVERFQGALLRLPLDPDVLADGARATPPDPDGARDEGRRLRTHPLPWFLLLGLLCLEWVGRRRRGLA